MPWLRTPDGQGVYHACVRGKTSISACRAPALEGDNLAHGPACGRSASKLCDGPFCDIPICPQHATQVEGKDLDYCPKHAHLASA